MAATTFGGGTLARDDKHQTTLEASIAWSYGMKDGALEKATRGRSQDLTETTWQLSWVGSLVEVHTPRRPSGVA
ncbi:hypothetical protein GUJ93_ZPchr0012g21825 [Zizania palustris]|uniref:Uncharacterized protein n=1 Tax=Zizania palustris TaxID=103762 RepID=A0A8J5WSH9_ZIZPA|nr:hypothetical protein GUJ93_ZPchr0012g21825 [Zizania palustris]